MPAPPRDPRKIRWARRRRAFVGFWRVFHQSRMGMVGLVMLGVFILVALTAPLFVSQADLSVSDPPASRSSLRRSSSRSARTTSVARCSTS